MPEAVTARTTLPVLAEPDRYRAATWDLTVAHTQRGYWLNLFRTHFPSLLEEAEKAMVAMGIAADEAQRRTAEARRQFFAYLDIITETPARYGRLDILEICYERERVLRKMQIDDPYLLAKQRENEAALARLPEVLAHHAALTGDELAVAVIKGVFAGNIFDLGATCTADRFKEKTVDFAQTLNELKDRPWHVDDLDAWLERLQGPAHQQALLFVDNAGPDVLLGMLPFARFLLARGTRVILTANTEPSLNDVTYDELRDLLEKVAKLDELFAATLADGRLRVVASGNNAPLIDLTRLSPELVAMVEAEPIDLLVLEGMGRGIESNFDAAFTCDTLKLAMIKDKGVADTLHGEIYDLVMRFEPVGEGV